jgi:hypothetical protein
MNARLRAAVSFLAALVSGLLYAVVVGLFAEPLRAPITAIPVLTIAFWLFFWEFKALRFAVFLWSLPIALIAFEFFWSASYPGLVTDQQTAVDRSHYKPGRIVRPAVVKPDPGSYGSGLSEVFFAADGFRADPRTGRGNPERCPVALIGDSMVYGSGLPYEKTFGPVLAEMGVRACVFGVTGNNPINYLSTARYVAERIDAGAYVAFYLYAYNDFVSLNRYANRGMLFSSKRFPTAFSWVAAFDHWRQSTFTFARFAAKRPPGAARCPTCGAARERASVWQYDFGASSIKIFYPRDPAEYKTPRPLDGQRRAVLENFFEGLKELSARRLWRVAVIVHPDESEFYANVARGAASFVDLDPRRAQALGLCQEHGFFCADISRHIYERARAAAENPYFANNRHFSAAGTRIVAQSVVAQAKEASRGTAASP